MIVARKLVLFLWLSSCAHTAMAQVVSTMPANATEKESFFLYEVKFIDEFIERFNDDKESYLRKQSVSLYGTDSFINRRRMVQSLFNKKQQWTSDVSLFVAQVIAGRQQYLSFTDSNWYAEVTCAMQYMGNETTLPLYLHIHYKNGAAQWKIAGIGAGIPIPDTPASPLAATVRGDLFLPTSSHGTDFIVFYQALSATGISAQYFEPAALPRWVQAFIAMVQQKQITFKYVKEVRYHFFTIPGWYFSVSRYKRKESNTGWLISTLKPMNEPEKDKYLQKMLGRKG
ncbi:MAG: hypothetical protein K9G49_04405 [Taibaiella sp.]|nr:hypothetical protein [Taibaiella sp.]